MQQRGQNDQSQPYDGQQQEPYEPTRSRSGVRPQWGAQTSQWAQQPPYGQPHQGQPGMQGDQPGWQVPPGRQQPPPKKKSKLGIGCLGVVGVFVIVLIAAAVAGGGHSGNAANAGTDNSGDNTPAAPATGAAAAAAPATTAAPVKTSVLQISGSGIKNTKSFTTGPDWSIKYSFDCANFGNQGNFAVSVYTADELSDVPVNALAEKGSDTTYEHGDSGTQYLAINSECSWTVTVTDGDGGQ